MPLSQEDITKIYQIREKLLTTYKAALSQEQKNRIKIHLSKLESIIEDIENGEEINPERLNIFSADLKKSSEENNSIDDTYNEEVSFAALIDIVKISENSKDKEMDLIYSFFLYFENHFFNIFTPKYLKLDYQFNKKRDLLFSQFDAFRVLLKQYKDDLELLSDIKFKSQLDQYKVRVEQQKKYLLVKLSELIHGFKDFTKDLLNDVKYGKNGFINFEDVFKSNLSIDETEFEDWSMLDIIKEADRFLEEFIDILRMPDFRRNV